MKNRLLALILCMILLLSCACAKESDAKKEQTDVQKKEELYNYEVTDEPFESMEIQHSLLDYISFENEQALFEAADMVFIGMPLDTFTDGEERYYDVNLQELKGVEGSTYRYTVRDIKVIEMLKGDKSLDTVSVADDAVVKEMYDGKQVIDGLCENSHIAKKNVKYIYYLVKSNSEEMDFYFTAYDGGLINIDGLDSKVGRADRVLAAKERLPEQFEKYDRSAELAAK